MTGADGFGSDPRVCFSGHHHVKENDAIMCELSGPRETGPDTHICVTWDCHMAERTDWHAPHGLTPERAAEMKESIQRRKERILVYGDGVER